MKKNMEASTMYVRKRSWVLIAVLTVFSLTATPVAFADGDHHDEHANFKMANVRLQNVLNAISADVTTLSNLGLDRDNDLESKQVRTMSLSRIVDHLDSSAATSLTNAANANSGPLQTFLAGGSAQAVAIDDALNAAGVAPSSALVIFPLRDDRLIVITS